MTDSTLRAMTDDATFRMVAVSTTQTVREVLSHQKPQGSTAEVLANLLTAAVLVRETMAPTHRVQAILKRSEDAGSVLADSHPSDGTRGLVRLPRGKTEFPLQGVMLQVMRSLHDGRMHQGVVSVRDASSVSEGLREYMLVSEQVEGFVAAETIFDGSEVVVSGGYLVQLLPGAGAAPLAFMAARMEEVGCLSQHLRAGISAPSALVRQVLSGIDYTVLDESELRFGCWCSAQRLLGALATLPRSDIEDFIRKGEILDISCDYCNRSYKIPPSKLRGLQIQS